MRQSLFRRENNRIFTDIVEYLGDHSGGVFLPLCGRVDLLEQLFELDEELIGRKLHLVASGVQTLDGVNGFEKGSDKI